MTKAHSSAASKIRAGASEASPGADRLYQRLARQLFQELVAGRYKVGDRLPAERELALDYNVSRPAVREAMIALEVQGLIEVRIGSGAYVTRLPGSSEARPYFNATAFELTEARLLIEGETAGLAAAHITDEEIDELDRLVGEIEKENQDSGGGEKADQAFHTLIARASRNAVLVEIVERLWELRLKSPDCALLLERARHVNVRPVVEEHQAIADAIRARDPSAARAAMRMHLGRVLDYHLFATEEREVAEVRRAAASKRERYARSASV